MRPDKISSKCYLSRDCFFRSSVSRDSGLKRYVTHVRHKCKAEASILALQRSVQYFSEILKDFGIALSETERRSPAVIKNLRSFVCPCEIRVSWIPRKNDSGSGCLLYWSRETKFFKTLSRLEAYLKHYFEVSFRSLLFHSVP